jgi:hypothetical protein
MKTTLLYFAFLIFAMSATNCMTVNLSATGYDKTASLTSINRKFSIVKHFSSDMKCWYTLVNLIPLTEPNVAEILRNETASSHGDAVINVNIQGQTTLVDAAILVALAFLGSAASQGRGVFLGLLIGARTYTIEGDVIKYVE